MANFWVEYHRTEGTARITEYPDAREALRRRIELDVAATDPNVENVVIAAADIEALRVTHSRYFASHVEVVECAKGDAA